MLGGHRAGAVRQWAVPLCGGTYCRLSRLFSSHCGHKNVANHAPLHLSHVARASRPPVEEASKQQGANTTTGSGAAGAGGSTFSAAVLVASTTVGAGILALPATVQDSGFVASSAALAGTALYSAATGLLFAEVNLNARRDNDESNVSMVRRTAYRFTQFGCKHLWPPLMHLRVMSCTAQYGAEPENC